MEQYLYETFAIALALAAISTMPTGIPISVAMVARKWPRSAGDCWFCVRLTLFVSGVLNLLVAISGAVMWGVISAGWLATDLGTDLSMGGYQIPVAAGMNAIFCAAAIRHLHPATSPASSR